MSTQLTAREKIIAARIQLMKKHPFFGSLAMHLRPIEYEEEEAKRLGIPTIAVDIYGNMPYNKAFIEKRSVSEVMFLVAHEIMHVALEHLRRRGNRLPDVWNYAADAEVNSILAESMRPPNDAVFVKGAEKQSTEELYDYIIRNFEKMKVQVSGYQWDVHLEGEGNQNASGGGKHQGKGQSGAGGQRYPFQRPDQEPLNPSSMIKEAAEFAKARGMLPAGIERKFKDLLNPKMDWRDVLQKFIAQLLPYDFTYMKPHKKSASTGVYMPSVLKEDIELIIAIDSSGSISDEEYAQFLTEVTAIVLQYPQVKGTLLICDAKIQNVIELDASFDPYSVHGGGYGGTSSIPVYEWIEKEKDNNIKLLIYFTDGWIDIPESTPPFPTIWVVTPQGDTSVVERMPNAIVIKMED